MSPFTNYLPCYAPGTVPERPWWRTVGTYINVTAIRSDGREIDIPDNALADAELMPLLDAYDAAHPLPVPPPMVGQVWARVEPAGEVESCSIGYACGDDVIVIGRPFTQLRFEHWSELRRSSLRDYVLVLGPTPWGRDCPWAPAGWRP